MARITRENRREHMLTTPMRRLIPAMALPTVASMVINSFYNLADTYFVSQLGTAATGAVGINGPLDFIMNLVGAFFAMGAASYMSRLLGAKEDKRAEQVLSTVLVLCFIISCILMVIGRIYVAPLVRFLGAIPEVEVYAIQYANWVLYAAPFFVCQFILTSALRSEGSATYAFIGTTLGGFLNCGLDPLFIWTFGMGVEGASIATAISKLVSFIFLLVPYLRKKTMVRINLRSFSLDKEVMAEVAKMGTPGLSRSALQSIAAIIMNRIAGAQFSAAALAAVSVTNRLLMTIRSACLGYAQGFQPVAGFCYGAKRYERCLEAYKFTSVSIIAIITGLSTVMFIFAPQIIRTFTQADADMLRIGILALRTQCLTMPLNAWTIVVNSLYSAAGRATGALIISTTRQGLCFFPLVYTLPRFFGLMGLVAVQPGAELLTVAIVIPLAIYIQRKIRQLQDEAASQPPEAGPPLSIPRPH